MSHTLEQFAAECHRLLKANPGPSGRQQVCTLLQEVLKDESFVTTHLGDDVPELKPFALDRYARGRTFGASGSHSPWV